MSELATYPGLREPFRDMREKDRADARREYIEATVEQRLHDENEIATAILAENSDVADRLAHIIRIAADANDERISLREKEILLAGCMWDVLHVLRKKLTQIVEGR